MALWKFIRAFSLFIVLLLVSAGGAQPAETGAPPAEETAAEAPAEEEFPDAFLNLDNPRAAMRTFLSNMRVEKEGNTGRWRVAAEALDLSDLPELMYDQEARHTAFDLHEIINRLERVYYENIPEVVPGGRYIPWTVDGIAITMVEGADGNWQFSQQTIDSIPDLFTALEGQQVVEGTQATEFADSPSTWFKSNLPGWLFQHTFILQNFEWIVIFFFIVIGFIADRSLRLFIRKVVLNVLDRRKISINKDPVYGTARWIGMAFAGLIWIIGLQWLDLPPNLILILWVAVLLFTISSMILAALAFIDFLAEVFAAKAAISESKFDDILVPLIRKSAKVFVVSVGVVFLADNLRVDITSLLAGLGIGGLAFALAAKDTVENVFGSIAILVDRPFQIGDWVKMNDVEGHVETVGLRSTRVRTFYNSLITVPNSNLIKASVDNLGLRRYRRVKTMISVTYNTPPEKIDMFCEGIREIIRQHPYTRKDNYHVWLNAFGPSSLDILLYTFHEVPDWATELRERHRLFLDVIRLAHRLGIEFAFPTQTLYLERGTGPAQPDPTPFHTRRDVMKNRAGARKEVAELVEKMLHDGTDLFPPPPVKYNVPMDPEEWALEPKNRGGTGADDDES